MNHTVKAIRKIRPESEFVIRGEDLKNIEWHVIDGDIPTEKEILEAIKLIQEEEAAELIQLAEKKSNILERLGITEEEAKILLS